jgi:hypothetical protein
VKKLVGKASTLSLSHAEAKARIQAAASRAVERVKEFSPWKIEGPIELKYYPGGARIKLLGTAPRRSSSCRERSPIAAATSWKPFSNGWGSKEGA